MHSLCTHFMKAIHPTPAANCRPCLVSLRQWLPFLFWFFVSACTCSSHIRRHPISAPGYQVMFFPQAVNPLKKTLPSLFCFLKKGHLLSSKQPGASKYLYSYRFYQYLSRYRSTFCQDPYLHQMEHFLAVFGEPEQRYNQNGRAYLSYFPVLIDAPCSTCTYSGFTFIFDLETGSLQCL